MLTKKGKYGLKALVHLAQLPAGSLAFINDIATKNRIPKKFLEAILSELRNAGFVQSRKGKEGGYRLACPAEEIKVGHVVRVLDGPLAPIPCASRTRYERCEDCDETTCQVRQDPCSRCATRSPRCWTPQPRRDARHGGGPRPTWR